MKDYIAVIEPADDGTWSAFVPDLPGCTSAGPTREEAADNVAEAIAGHIEALIETGQPVPEPGIFTRIVHVA